MQDVHISGACLQYKMRFFRLLVHVGLSVCLGGGVLFTAGCATLPKNPPRMESHTLGPADAGVLADISVAARENFQPDESAFMLLEDNADALLWRLALIDHATTSIEMQSFIWENDETGRLLLARLLDFPIADDEVALLARQPNFNLRLFNPTSLRRGVIGPIMEMGVFQGIESPDAQ